MHSALDFAQVGCYTPFVRNPKREFCIFWFSCTYYAGRKQNYGRLKDSERDRIARRRRGMQKLSGTRIGSGRHFGKCACGAHQRGNRKPAGGRESLRSGRRQKDQGVFLSLFCLPGWSLSPSLYASARNAVQINQYLIIFYRRNNHELRQNL